MIIQLRGTSGSGKSTAMRAFMEASGTWIAHNKEGRRRPLYYTANDLDCPNGVAVLGHYESPCGGCDTVGSARAVYELIRSLPGYNIVCEGLLLSEDVKWTSQLDNVVCLFLTTPLDVCLERVAARRAAAGNLKPLDPANTAGRVKTVERARVKLLSAGVRCRRLSARQVPATILELLKGGGHGAG